MTVIKTHEFLVLVEDPIHLRQYCLNNHFDIYLDHSDPDKEETIIGVMFDEHYNRHNKPIILERYLKAIKANYVYKKY